MTSRILLLLSPALLFCVTPAARSATTTENVSKPSPATNQAGPVFSLGGISIAPGPQCFAGPSGNAGASAKPQATHSHRPAHRSRRVSEPVPLRTYVRI